MAPEPQFSPIVPGSPDAAGRGESSPADHDDELEDMDSFDLPNTIRVAEKPISRRKNVYQYKSGQEKTAGPRPAWEQQKDVSVDPALQQLGPQAQAQAQAGPPGPAGEVNEAQRMLDSAAITALSRPPTLLEEKEHELDIESQIAQQREGRRVNMRPKGEREISEGLAQSRAQEGRSKWQLAKELLQKNRSSIHLLEVSNEGWVDTTGLFYYYNEIYFEKALTTVTFSWINREDNDEQFRYCLCSTVPNWWHGTRKLLCAGIACEYMRVSSGIVEKKCHIRLPEALRKFKLVEQTKEALLHMMIHAYIFMKQDLGTADLSANTAHNQMFRQLMYRLNTETLTVDLYRPPQGYHIIFSDTQEVEEEEVRLQGLIDGFSDEHYKMLYLLSKYTRIAERKDDKEIWIRHLSLMVLIYEGIVNKVFDYDYAPASQFVSGRRIYMNITQEGKDNVEDLLEAKLVRGIRLTTPEHQPVIAYQCSVEGLDLLLSDRPSKADRRLVDSFCTIGVDNLLLQVQFDTDKFVMRNAELGVAYDSDVTDTEDVSYVCSPYLPFTLRDLSVPLTSNRARAGEAAKGQAAVKDEMDNAITLSKIVIMVGEFIPFGCSQISEVSQKLCVRERIKGGYFTPLVDLDPMGTTVEMPVGLTRVNVNSYNESQYLNVEAEVDYPEEEGIVQIENFGIRFQRNGVSTYGLRIEAVMDAIMNNISLDFMSRVMTDIHIDSSRVADSLISPHQRKLLQVVFAGHAQKRNKVNVFIAEKIEPKLRAANYLDGDALESELKQIIGDTYHAFDITENDIVIFGALGILFVGPDCMRFETLLLAYLGLKSREIFVYNFFNRLFTVDDALKAFRVKIENVGDNPNNISDIKAGLDEIYEDVRLLQDCLYYMNASLQEPTMKDTDRPTKASKDYTRLYQVLQIDSIESSLRMRVEDCDKQVEAVRTEINFLISSINNCSFDRLQRVRQDAMNFYAGCKMQMRLNDAASSTYDVMQVILAGELAFGVMDRIYGDWNTADVEWNRLNIFNPLVLDQTMYWFYFSMLLWLVGGGIVLVVLRQMKDNATGMISTKVRVARMVALPTMMAYLAKKEIYQEEVYCDTLQVLETVTWQERKRGFWENYAPIITLKLDAKNAFVHDITIVCEKPASQAARIFPRELQRKILFELEENEVWVSPESTSESGTDSKRGNLGLTLICTREGHHERREVHLIARSIAHLQEKVAAKFCYRVESIVSVKFLREVEGEDEEELLEVDEQVSALRPFTHIEVTFVGNPDPQLNIFMKELKSLQNNKAPGEKIDLKKMSNAKK